MWSLVVLLVFETHEQNKIELNYISIVHSHKVCVIERISVTGCCHAFDFIIIDMNNLFDGIEQSSNK